MSFLLSGGESSMPEYDERGEMKTSIGSVVHMVSGENQNETNPTVGIHKARYRRSLDS